MAKIRLRRWMGIVSGVAVFFLWFNFLWEKPIIVSSNEATTTLKKNVFYRDKAIAFDTYPFCSQTEMLVRTSTGTLVNLTSGLTACSGANYNAFTEALWKEIRLTVHLGQQFTIPHNRQILLVGSKFIMKLAWTWMCQHQASPLRTYEPPVMETSVDKLVTRYSLPRQNTTLWVVTDSYFVYSPRWQSLLEDQLSNATENNHTKQLATHMDAVVVGMNAQCSDTDTTQYTARMQRYAQQFLSVDCFNHTPPSLVEWAEIVPAHVPVVYVSLPNLERVPEAQEQLQGLLRQQSRSYSNVRIVSGRRYLDVLAQQCFQQPACVRGAGSPRRPCTGAEGGIMDTIVWDVADALQSVWRNNDNESKDEPSPLPWECPGPLSSINASIDVSNDRKVCRAHHIVASPQDVLATPIQLTYWCEGPQYDVFAPQLHDYMNQGPATWGRRLLPTNRRILVVGNSHTRQVTYSLLCQQQEYLQFMQELHFHGPLQYRFCPLNTTVVTVFNSHWPYSHRWRELLQDELREPLTNFDAIVLGLFNHCGGTNSFSRDMEALTSTMPDVDCLRISPPTIRQWANVYDGALIFVSMFSTNQLNESQAALADIQSLQNEGRTNVAFVDARRHVTALRNECASFNRSGVSDCAQTVENEDVYNATHRCVGIHGGHPDLTAWDVLEHLHETLVQ